MQVQMARTQDLGYWLGAAGEAAATVEVAMVAVLAVGEVAVMVAEGDGGGEGADRLELHRRKAFLLVEGGHGGRDRGQKEDEGEECHESIEDEADTRSQDGRSRGLGDDAFELHELALVLVDPVLRPLPINPRLGVRCLLQDVAHLWSERSPAMRAALFGYLQWTPEIGT